MVQEIVHKNDTDIVICLDCCCYIFTLFMWLYWYSVL